MRSTLISELLDESGLGIKVRVDGTAPTEALRAVGESWAEAARRRAERIWVWVYAADMDEEGPAISVTYVEGDGDPVFALVPASQVLLYYLGPGSHQDAPGSPQA